MDRLYKESGWDLTEFDREDTTQLAALVGSNGLARQKNRGALSVDLKLGGLGDLGNGIVDKLRYPRSSSVSSSRSSKRAGGLNGTQNMSCLVDGCTSELSSCREYHRRRRVCERHSKTPVVIIGGKEQRFCQQCSRFQSLGEFDDVKRSCRKRLDGHNRRRRKPQPESLYISSGSFLSNQLGARFLQFSGPEAYPTLKEGGGVTGPSLAKHHEEFHAQSTSNSFTSMYSGRDKEFPFLLAYDPEEGKQAAPEVSISGRSLNTNAPTESSMGHLKSLSDKLTQLVGSKSALSLLSTNPTQTMGTSLGHLMQQDVTRLNQSADTGVHFNCQARYSEGTEDRTLGLGLATDPVSTSTHCNELFPDGPHKLLENGPYNCFHFPGSNFL